MEEITSITYLFSTVGTVAIVTVITQYVKELLPDRIPIRAFILALCLIIQIGLTLLLSPSIEQVILATANSFVAAASCMGAYEATFNRNGNG